MVMGNINATKLHDGKVAVEQGAAAVGSGLGRVGALEFPSYQVGSLPRIGEARN